MKKNILMLGNICFFERHYLTSSVDAQDITGGSISIPEGYSVYDIENFTRKYSYGSETGGYDVWFINDVPVEVEVFFFIVCYNWERRKEV